MQRRSFSRELKVEAVRLVKRFDEVSSAPAPSAQLRDEDGLDPAGSGQCQNLAALGARVVGA